MNANVEKNVIQKCSEIRAPSHYGKKCRYFDYPIKYFQKQKYEYCYNVYTAKTMHN